MREEEKKEYWVGARVKIEIKEEFQKLAKKIGISESDLIREIIEEKVSAHIIKKRRGKG